MKYSARIQEILNTLYARNLPLAYGTDEQRRSLTQLIIEQVVFEFPTGQYGSKRAVGGAQSKDVLAQQLPDRLIGWDLFNGTTREPNQFPENIELPGQIFISIQGVDHLNLVIDAPANPPPVGKTEIQRLQEVVSRLSQEVLELKTQQSHMQADIQELRTAPVIPASVDTALLTELLKQYGVEGKTERDMLGFQHKVRLRLVKLALT